MPSIFLIAAAIMCRVSQLCNALESSCRGPANPASMSQIRQGWTRNILVCIYCQYEMSPSYRTGSLSIHLKLLYANQTTLPETHEMKVSQGPTLQLYGSKK
ncbi:hypothetical protein GDO78_011261 [Eleutherodactylus coqui]|uniref:Secreted protein n=1 Tax=Eleutherodactylus coqui TaxID=57060 RepID=A0A8J6F8I5_ELECQ|nr:hypothetical protein GDO78_011261 [Eleutherodactylus coqui]